MIPAVGFRNLPAEAAVESSVSARNTYKKY